MVSVVISSVDDEPESEPASRSKAVGAAEVVSTVIDNAEDATDTLPAGSVCVAVSE